MQVGRYQRRLPLQYEEYEFLKKRYIRFPLIFFLLVVAVFWQGWEAPNYIQRGARVDGIFYHQYWSTVTGFASKPTNCWRELHNQLVEIEWIEFGGRRVAVAVRDPLTKRLHYEIETRIRENAEDNDGLYGVRLFALLLALLLLYKTEWDDLRN